ncbi:hypothetical protein [Streptomyces sp. V3I7]|uniref:hypothetical protein n=1 Tax=Streptomyces sp. V3I7 TaxID=3042278 RepID=UPI002787405D|nr:hypothetical protein [Streptomyces sp. V3I7]MDQ0992196.1 hypothetical protein [Streptomyces sp. V3I7]
MTKQQPGQWPAGSTRPLKPAPVSGDGHPPQDPPRVEVPVPDVRLVVTVDLTGRYDSGSEVSRDLYEQTRYSTDCHTAIVRLGEDALRVASGLGSAIASRFFLAAREVEIHVPAGTRWAYVATEAQQYMRHYAADHAQMLSKTRTPG